MAQPLDAAWRQAFDSKPDRPCYSDPAITIDARHLDDRIETAARVLAAAPTDGPIGLLLDDPIQWLSFVVGSSRAGVDAVLVDPGLPPADQIRALDLAGATNLVAVGAFDSTGAVGRWARAVVWIDEGDCWLTSNQASSRPSSTDPTEVGESPALTVFTSGTEGFPKPIRLTHQSLAHQINMLESLRKEFFSGSMVRAVSTIGRMLWRHGRHVLGGAGRQVFLTGFAPHTIAGLTVLLHATLAGHHLVWVDPLDGPALLDAITTHRVTVVAGSPPTAEVLVRAIEARPPEDPADVSSLLVVGLGGGPVSPDLVAHARQALGCEVLVGYGLTEMVGSVSVTRVTDTDDKLLHTVGRPLPGADLRIVDSDGHAVEAGGPGEVLCRSSLAPLDDLAGRTVVDDDGAAWLTTGDIGLIDADGYLVILGRRDDVIVRGGRKIAPGAIEQAITQHPRIERAAVVGKTDLIGGQRLEAYVELNDDGPLARPELVRYLRPQLPLHMIPDRLHVVDRLPEARDGNVDRGSLRARD